MILFPAIDIKDGNVVRLLKGDFNEVTEYSSDPVAIAKIWQGKGAQWLHVVDLDGALLGELKNKEIILKIAQSIDIPIQVGGGIRTTEDIQYYMDGGIARVILGTKVIEDRAFLKDVLKKWSNKIAVSVDCSNGFVAQRGWTIKSDIKAIDLIRELEALGVTCIIYTDIARDGMLSGPNLDGLKEILQITNIPVIASGGISGIEDVKAILALESDGVIGAISGKAIYEGKLDIKKAVKLCSQKE